MCKAASVFNGDGWFAHKHETASRIPRPDYGPPGKPPSWPVPPVPPGNSGWGAKAALDVGKILAAA